MPSSEVDRLKKERERLRQEHAAGVSGLTVVRAISDATDDAIVSIWSNLRGPQGCALVALGGYGRRELSPSSDIDLALLQPKRGEPVRAVKALAYELWDAGLELGYATYTPKEALRLSKERIDAAATFFDARLLAGDQALFREWMDDLLRWARNSRRQLIDRLADATAARHREKGDAGAELEPNVKEARGGLRDLVTIGWLAKLAGDTNNGERAETAAAAGFLHQVRNELHYLTGRRTDVLLMQHQPAVASAIVGRRGDVPAEDQLMRTLYEHARNLAFALDTAFLDTALRASDPGNASVAAPLVSERVLLFREAFDGSQPAWNEPARAAFMSILRSAQARRELEELDRLGLLVQALPEWALVRCLPQRNIYHRFAVDIHSFELVSALAGMSIMSPRGEDLVHQVFAVVNAEGDLDLLLVAGLLHDIGKGQVQDHAVRGEELARSAVERMGIEGEAAGHICWLVRHHLMLSEAAARRDVGDESFVVQLAEKVESERRLRLLYLLTVADGVATGPSGWSPWKATLLNRVFTRLSHALQDEFVGGRAGMEATETIEKLRAALDAYPAGEVKSHLSNMPRAWLLSQPFEALLQQSSMMLDPPAPADVKISAAPQSEAGIWEATIVARDRPGLFSKIAGSLALHGLNVVGADVYTREDGLALEIFRLEALGDEEHRFDRVVADITRALRGRLALGARLAEKRRDYAWRISKGRQEPPRVVIDNRSSDFFTVIEVHAPDRVGLLYTITSALSDMDLDIHTAKIATYAHDVIDVFYVRDLEGQKVVDPEHIAEIERTILHRLAAGG